MSHPTTSFSSLISQIVDSHSETEQIQAIHSLGWWYPRDALHELLTLFDHPFSSTILRVLLETILELLRSEITEVQRQELLSIFPFQRFLHHTEWRIRKVTLEIIKGLQEDNHLSEVIEALQDPEAMVRQEAVSALVNFGSKIQSNLIQMFDDPNEDVINEAINSVRKLELKLPMALRNRLRLHPRLKIRVNYANTIMTLAIINPEIYADEVSLYLNDTLPYLQATAIETLATIHDTHLIELLPEFLAHSDESVVEKALNAVSSLQVLELLPLVLKKLKDSRRNVRKAALHALGTFSDPSYLLEIFPSLYDDFEDIRTEVYAILKNFKDPQSILPLLDRLRTATILDKPKIWDIFDQFRIYDLIIPFAREYRNNSHADPYIINRLQEHIPDMSILKQFPNLGISTLVELLKTDTLWEGAAEVLIGWGFRALKILESSLTRDKDQNLYALSDIPNPTSELQKTRIQTVILRIRDQMEIQTDQGFTLLM